MLFLGNLEGALGDVIYGPFETHPGTYVAAAPTGTPTGTAYLPSNYAAGTSISVTITVTAFSGSTTRFVATFTASSGNGFAKGQYIVIISWVISGVTYRGWFNLRIY